MYIYKCMYHIICVCIYLLHTTIYVCISNIYSYLIYMYIYICTSWGACCAEACLVGAMYIYIHTHTRTHIIHIYASIYIWACVYIYKCKSIGACCAEAWWGGDIYIYIHIYIIYIYIYILYIYIHLYIQERVYIYIYIYRSVLRGGACWYIGSHIYIYYDCLRIYILREQLLTYPRPRRRVMRRRVQMWRGKRNTYICIYMYVYLIYIYTSIGACCAEAWWGGACRCDAQNEGAGCLSGTQFTCFTSTKVQIMTPEEWIWEPRWCCAVGDCSRMLTYAHACSRMLTSHVCSRMLTYAHVCWMLTNADVCCLSEPRRCCGKGHWEAHAQGRAGITYIYIYITYIYIHTCIHT